MRSLLPRLASLPHLPLLAFVTLTFLTLATLLLLSFPSLVLLALTRLLPPSCLLLEFGCEEFFRVAR